MNFLHNALLIANWITNFDSKSVNDCFDNEQNRVPTNLSKYEKTIDEDLKKINQMKLSPNNATLNHNLMNQTRQIFGMQKQSRLGKHAGVPSPVRNNFKG